MTEIRVEVVYGTSERQELIALSVSLGTTVIEAIKRSGIAQQFGGIDLADVDVGIFSKRCSLDVKLSDGDRVEIYRPLIIDPKEARRQRANKGVSR